MLPNDSDQCGTADNTQYSADLRIMARMTQQRYSVSPGRQVLTWTRGRGGVDYLGGPISALTGDAGHDPHPVRVGEVR